MLERAGPNLFFQALAPEPRLKAPTLLVGLPGMGHVAKLSAEYLVEQLGARPFLRLLSPAFPPYIVCHDGMVEATQNELYYWKGDPDLIIYTGNTQPENSNPGAVRAHYEIAEAVLGLALRLGAARLVATAAYILERPVEDPRVWAVATDPKTLGELKQIGVQVMREGSITGLNGLVLGIAAQRSLAGACLLGESSTPQTEDPRAARAVLEVAAKWLGLSLDLKGLEKRIKSQEKAAAERQAMERKMIEQLLKRAQPEGPGGAPPSPDYIR
ncbi:MAG: PAC2 family protein [Halobacteria archaeon]